MTTSVAPFETESHYLTLRFKLITFFHYRRCSDPENLADETVTRIIASHARGITPADVNRWGYGIARRVYLEWLRDPSRQAEPGAGEQADEVPSANGERFRIAAHTVIGRLLSEDRDLLEERFLDGKKAKILAQPLGLTPEAIRSRICRLRQSLSRQFASEMR